MKLLYLDCCHPVLSYDNCITFEELGIDWFCTGVYMNPKKPLSFLNIRTAINREVDENLLNLFLYANPHYFKGFVGLTRPTPILTAGFVNNFDVIFSTSYKYIISNWEVIKHKPIIWRTSGAINEAMEKEMSSFCKKGNIFPVRFSNQELLSPYSNGGHVIRNFADESIYLGWTGTDAKVLSFQSWFTQRRKLPINKFYLSSIYPQFNCKLYGAFTGAKDPISMGTLDWKNQIEEYKKSRVYFYIGSPVGVVAYNYIEAMMVGCPIVTVGSKIGGYNLTSKSLVLHEPSEFIENEIDGFYSDNPSKVREYIQLLLDDYNLALCVSKKARAKALNMFSKKKAITEWRNFFNETFNG